jgi:DNA-binding response OmpR family regulator
MSTTLCNLERTADAPPTGRAPSLILVTDDDEDTRFLFRTLLEMRGYAVIEAADGLEAVEVAERARPDLILIDGSLPRLDGLSATRRIRELGRGRSVPIILITGRTEPAFRTVAREAGCDEFLVKPFDVAQLDAMVGKHLSQRSASSARPI